MFYLIEEGDAHCKIGRYSWALKRYCAVQRVPLYVLRSALADCSHDQVFDEIEDDQYDFHGYSLRKFTINIYLKLIFVVSDTLRR
jgi:peptide alpha-N-acetyltransferase